MIIISRPYQESMHKGLFSSVFKEMNYINNCKNIEDTLRYWDSWPTYIIILLVETSHICRILKLINIVRFSLFLEGVIYSTIGTFTAEVQQQQKQKKKK